MKSIATEDLLYCERCKRTLIMYDPEPEGEEGDDMYIVPSQGGELIYCADCFKL